jgi:hypothetical protein
MLPKPQAIDSIVTKLGKANLARWRRRRRSGFNYLLDKLFQIAHSTVPERYCCAALERANAIGEFA